MSLFFVILLALGLSIDSFAVSLSCGFCSNITLNLRAYRFALTLAFIQGLMLFLGWLTTNSIHELIDKWDYWIAFLILTVLGGKMLWDSLTAKSHNKGDNQDECCCNNSIDIYSFKRGLILGVATSIDALTSGVAINIAGVDIIANGSDITNILVASAITLLITFLASITGLLLGREIGNRYNLSKWGEIIAAIILILLGIKILLDNL